jgi:hypothetical protein
MKIQFKKISFKNGTGYALEIGKLGIFVNLKGFAIDYIGGFHFEYYRS